MRATVYLFTFLFFATLFWFFRYLSGFVWVLELLLWACTAFFLQFLMHTARYASKKRCLHSRRMSNALWAMALVFALADFGLRFGTTRWLTWNERNHGFYTSLYTHSGHKWWLHPADSSLYYENAGAVLSRGTNSLGLSCPEIPMGKPKGQIRVFAFGNSYTEGYSVEAGQAWPAQLEGMLKKQQDRPVEVFNVAVSGTDPFFSYRLFIDTLIYYKPDVVVLALNREDVNKLTYRGGMERFREDGQVQFRPAPWWEPFYKSSMLVRVFAEAIGYNDFLMKEKVFEKRLHEGAGDLSSLALTWQKKCKANGMDFIILAHPAGGEIKQGRYAPFMQSLTAKLSGLSGLPMANALGHMKGKDGLMDSSGLYLSPKAHKAMARSVLPFFAYENRR